MLAWENFLSRRLSAAEPPAGPMPATGIHLLDLSIGVFGPAQCVYASVKQLGSDRGGMKYPIQD